MDGQAPVPQPPTPPCDSEQRLADAAQAERVARAFHDTYEALAPLFGYQTRPDSARPWQEVPFKNRALMETVVRSLIVRGVIKAR